MEILYQGVALIRGWISYTGTVWNNVKDYLSSLFGGNKSASSGGGGGRSFGSSGANVIKVSTEEMAATVAEYQNQKNQLMEALNTCSSAAQTLAQSWAGPSFLQMSIKLAATYKNLRESITKMDDAIDELNKTIGNMEQAEKNVQSAMASLEIGTSPFL